ncbi:FecR family protein [Pedobacter sp. ok626]|uniref:FecR family protein n=1 Tax=Pedobacter sp. ok626 TaxID=1761882 RepID=UPI000880AF6C|nr:FecR family protein [Pedobacter sp. ok626]SDL83751.1 FecR family protein [Pedobacter sp. ok626]
MERTKEQFETLLNKYLDKSCSLEELKKLFSYIDLPEYRERLEIVMDENYKTLVPGAEVDAINWDEMFSSIVEDRAKGKVRSLWLPIAAAIIVMLSVGILTWDNQQQKKQKTSTVSIKKDIAPGGNKAVLKLADGTEIVLDGHSTGMLADEDGTKISKTAEGMLLYDAAKSDGDETLVKNHINTLTTPSGGQYMLILPDHSKVWLNAESSISYPSVFSGEERNVSLIGEAYFEVAKDKQHPFKVKAGAMEVKVLGTHFNIMSYAEEGQTQVALAEGSVRIDLGNNSRTLIPGQQASIKAGSMQISLRNVDIDEVTNWKNGLFQFDNTPLEQVMRQIKRWYSVDVVYQGVKPDLYITGMISRSNNVSKILALIEETGGIDFVIGDKQIIVKKAKGGTMTR